MPKPGKNGGAEVRAGKLGKSWKTPPEKIVNYYVYIVIL